MAGRAGHAGAHRRARARTLRAERAAGRGAPPCAGLAAAAPDAVCQHHFPAGPGTVPGPAGNRTEAGSHHALECAGDGGARQPAPGRTRRPYLQLRFGGRPVRSGLQPFLPRPRGRAGRPRRRPGVLPAAFGAGGLCARLSRRALERSRPRPLPPGGGGARPAPGGRHGARLELLPAPLADARLLAVPDRFHGPGATVGGVSGPVHALPGTPRPDPAQ